MFCFGTILVLCAAGLSAGEIANTFDLSLVRTRQEVLLTDHVRPIHLPRSRGEYGSLMAQEKEKEEEEEKGKDLFFLLGWGSKFSYLKSNGEEEKKEETKSGNPTGLLTL